MTGRAASVDGLTGDMRYATPRVAPGNVGPLGIQPAHRDFCCGRYERLPRHPGRIAEGGARLAGRVRSSEPDRPLVSVVTVVHNRADTIGQCVESVLGQTWNNVEYLIIDGGSDDGTLEIIEAYAGDIDYYVSQPDDGIYAAMNAGLALAHGDYILLLNSDDWYREDAIALLLEAARRSGAEVTHADAITVDARGRKTGVQESSLHAGLYTARSLIRHETMLVRRDVYERFGAYDASYRIIADYLFAIQLLDAGCAFEHVRERLLYFRETGISRTAERLRIDERERLFAGLFPFLGPEDLTMLSRGQLTERQMAQLIADYENCSEAFTRSLALNIAASPSFRLADAVFERIARLGRGRALWKAARPLRRWLARRLTRPRKSSR